jgi:hypothetical protein
MVVYSAGLDKSVKVWRIRVVGKEEEDDEDEDEDDGEDEVEDIVAAGKGDVDAVRDEVDAEEEQVVSLGPTPVLSPVWVEKRRHTSRG